MFIIQNEFSFDAAHRLDGHEGKCSRLHGHRWRVFVQVQGNELKEEGSERDMIVDMGDLKKDLKEIEDLFDHKEIIEGYSLEFYDEMAFVPFRPTAERLAEFIYHEIERRGYNAYQAIVYETPTNAVYYREG